MKLKPGLRGIQFGRYTWRVLDVRNGRALLLSENVLEKRAYHGSMTSTTWESCDMRKYLNDDFLQTFGSEEQSRIVETVHANRNNTWYGAKGGGRTKDKIFLLSIAEMIKYFGNSGRFRKGARGEYVIDDRFDSVRIAKDGEGNGACWWLRSPGCGNCHAALVTHHGAIFMSGFGVFDEEGGVRPALWVRRDMGTAFRQDVQQTGEAEAAPVPGSPPGDAGSAPAAGQRSIQFGRYTWRVLDVQDGRALLLSENVLEERTCNDLQHDADWEDCELRRYLNGDFLQTFSSEEQSRIVETVNVNACSLRYGVKGGGDTKDKIFLLSIDEAAKYFGDSGGMRVRKGWYLGDGVLALEDGAGVCLNAPHHHGRSTEGAEGKAAWWWLRSPGCFARFTDDVLCVASLRTFGSHDRLGAGGVRPALWLHL